MLKSKEIAEELNIAIGTVKRWSELKKVPKQYCFELMKMANIDIDYSKFTYREKDQFFTSSETAKYCYDKSMEIINQYDDDDKDCCFTIKIQCWLLIVGCLVYSLSISSICWYISLYKNIYIPLCYQFF